jgi:hypothetical protein
VQTVATARAMKAERLSNTPGADHIPAEAPVGDVNRHSGQEVSMSWPLSVLRPACCLLRHACLPPRTVPARCHGGQQVQM